MNNPLSAGNESVIDIFVLGRSETGTLQLMEQLEHQDYRVTLFTEGTQLIDTLHHSGKPNLIICDTISFGQEAYEYCRQIKSDDNLWMIPVMILTRASSLGDLLYVLDGNADNFIAQPYDSPYLLSLVEGMLTTPVERQTTDQIKTQFKIQHEGRVFVVTADRRKLLEFLLSAFEIAVKNSEDLSSAHTELQALSSRLTMLEEAGTENARLIGMLNASVKNKEQDERTLKGDLEESEQALDEKTAEAGQLSRALGDARALLATAEDHIRILLEEKETTAHSHRSETSLLTEQVSSHSQVIGTKTTELEAAQAALEEEKKRSAMLDLAIRESNAKREQLETSLQAITLEHEQLASAFSSEKDRAESAELDARSVLQAKVQSEEVLTHLIDEMKESARQQNDEFLRLKSVLEAETDRCRSAETQLETIRHEFGQVKATHELQEDAHKQQLDELQGRLDSSIATIFSEERELKILKDELIVAHAEEEKTAAAAAAVTTALNETRAEIEEREWKIQSLGKQIADAGIQKEAGDEKVRVLSASLERIQSALDIEKGEHAAVEERLNAAIHERDETLQSVLSAHDQTKTDLDLHKNNLLQLNQDLDAAALLRSTLQGDITAASSRIKELEHELKTAVQAKDQTGQQSSSLREELEGMKTAFNEARLALAGEKEAQVALREQLNAAIRERDETLQTVRGVHDQTKTDLDLHKDNLLRLNQDLEAATRIYSVLLTDFKAASSRIDELESELNSVIQGKEQAGQQVRSLSDDLERTKAELETERRIRRTAEMNLQNAALVTSRLEGDIARSTAEQEALKATLVKEQAEHEFTPVKEAREQHDDLRAAKIQKLNQDFELLLARQHDLEQKVQTLESGKAAAEARADALTDEIQQARTALADEWENHMNVGERLAATERKAVQLEESLSGTRPAAPERERKWAVVVRQADLPAEIRPVPVAIVATPPPATRAEPVPPATPDNDQEVFPSLEIEDLFEDVHSGPGVADRIDKVPESDGTGSAAETRGVIPEEDPAREPEPADEQEAGQESDEPEEDEDEAGDQRKNLDDFMTAPSSYGISFNRQQWLALLKWSHHSGDLSPEQRMQIVRMGRLIQNGRKLTKKQDEQVREMMVLVQTLGYRFH
jgi:chromosome segregation ATPase